MLNIPLNFESKRVRFSPEPLELRDRDAELVLDTVETAPLTDYDLHQIDNLYRDHDE